MENHTFQDTEHKKRYLKRYRKNVACVRRLEVKLRILDDRIMSVKSPSFSGMPRGANPVTLDELLSDKFELEERITRLKNKGRKLKIEILETIDSLEDSKYCEILEAYFIDCQTIEDIAEDMGYTVRYVYDLYSTAINLISLNVQ